MNRKLKTMLAAGVIIAVILFVIEQVTVEKLLRTYHSQIEQAVSDKLGQKFRFADIKLDWKVGVTVRLLSPNFGNGYVEATAVVVDIDLTKSFTQKQPIIRKIHIEGLKVNLAKMIASSSQQDISAEEILNDGMIANITSISADRLMVVSADGSSINLKRFDLKILNSNPKFIASQLKVSGLKIKADEIMRTDILVDHLDTKITLSRDLNRVTLSGLFISNRDVVIKGVQPIVLENGIKLNAQIKLSHVEYVSEMLKYIPRVVPESAYQWLANGFSRGEISSAVVDYHGNLDKTDWKEAFKASLEVSDLDIKFSPVWPSADKITGIVRFEGDKIFFEASAAESKGMKLVNGSGVVESLGQADTRLVFDLHLTGHANDALSYLAECPLRTKVPLWVDQFEVLGPLALKIAIELPLVSQDEPIVTGAVIAHNSEAIWKLHNMSVTKINGAVHFSRAGLLPSTLTGEFYDRPAVVELTPERNLDGGSKLTADFAAFLPVVAIKKMYPNQAIETYAKGGAQFEGKWESVTSGSPAEAPTVAQQTDFPAGPLKASENQIEAPKGVLTVHSSLEGLDLKLPAPLGKTAKQRKDLSLVYVAGKQKKIESIKVTLDKDLEATYDNMGLAPALNINLSHLHIPEGKDESNDKSIGPTPSLATQPKALSTLDPREFPATQFSCKEVLIGKAKLGHVNLVTEKTKDGIKISNLDIASGYKKFSGVVGSWEMSNGTALTTIAGKLQSDNLQNALKEWGRDNAGITKTEGHVDFDLAWIGAPHDFDAANLKGNLEYEFVKGTIINSSVGGSILKLIKFKVDQLFNEEIAFEKIKGKFDINRGSAQTEKSLIDLGPFHLNLTGSLALADETMDMDLDVKPDFQWLPISHARKAGKLFGDTIELADDIITSPVKQFSTFKYSINGPIAKPEVSLIEYGKMPIYYSH